VCNNVLIKVILSYHVKGIAGAPYKIKQNEKQKGQKRWQSVVVVAIACSYTALYNDGSVDSRSVVVVARQQLYCAVQSRSSMTTENAQSSPRNSSNGTFLTDDAMLFHTLPKPQGGHSHCLSRRHCTWQNEAVLTWQWLLQHSSH